MYCDQLSKYRIGLFMRKNSIKSYSEFLRLATFFLMNDKIKSTKPTVWSGWEREKEKVSTITNKEMVAHSAVINELKQLFKNGEEILKKIE